MGILESETIDLEAPTGGRVVEPSCCLGDTLSDRYRLDEEIGRGGMGIVFRAWDSELERAVAVKVIAADREDVDACERLFREARAAAALHHPHVVAVYDVGEHEGMPYFVMELIEGPSLRDQRPKTLDETVVLAVQICDALGHAHEQGLVHRDLKPGNVLVDDSREQSIDQAGGSRSRRARARGQDLPRGRHLRNRRLHGARTGPGQRGGRAR